MLNKSRVVTIELVGGVGNQLFQYFAGRYVASNNNTHLELDTSKIGIGGRNHGSAVSDFAIDEIEIYSKTRNVFYQSIFGRIHGYFLRKIRFYAFSMHHFMHLYQSPVLGYDPALDELKAPIRISGYFQTDYYYNYLIKAGIKKLELKNKSPWYESTLRVIEKNESLIIHIRRGDYIPLKDTFGLLSKKFYEAGAKRIRDEFRFTDVFIFSDDIGIAKSMKLSFDGAAIHYVTPPSESPAVESILLMSAGKGMILSNSTFAWWSAVLGQMDYVVCPADWFKDLDPPKNLALNSWKLIESDWES